MSIYDCGLIVGDFNINVCCTDKLLVKEKFSYFIFLVHSFNLVQCVVGPSHQLEHTLDLVLLCGSSVLNLKIGYPVFSFI